LPNADLAQGRVTVSTVGIVSKIRQLSVDLPEVSLALSLHAPNQKLRETIVPTAHRYPITDLIDALDNHMNCYDNVEQTKRVSSKTSSLRKVMIEYVLLEGPTSSLEAAHELGRLCQNRKFVVNLIPYNSTNSEMKCPPREQMRAFRSIVVSYGVFCTIRRTMGADIDSACGQLVKKQQQQQATDIEDVVTSGEGSVLKSKSSSVTATNNAIVARDLTTTTPQEQTNRPKDLGDYVDILSVATALAACSFIISLTMFLRKGRGP
jgi:hypothetical protein